MTTQDFADEINAEGFGFLIERAGPGWETPWVAIDKQTSLATPMTDYDLITKHYQLFPARAAARILASIRTPARAAASRENGRKGGRPRKQP